MRKKKGRLLGWLLGFVLGMTALFPASAEAAEAAEGYVMRKAAYYNADGAVSWWSEYEYDENGNLTKSVRYDGGTVSGWSEYEYDGNGNQVKVVWYSGNGTVGGWSEYEYDGNGNQTKYMMYNSDGAVIWYESWTAEYDGNGNQTKYVGYNADGTVGRCLEREYDGNGNLTKDMHSRDGSQEQMEGWIFEYDEKGRRTKEISYSAAYGKTRGWTFEYDENGNLTKRFSDLYSNGVCCLSDLSEAYSYEYDGNGNQTKCTAYTKGVTAWTAWTAEYDGNGNQTKRMDYYEDGTVKTWVEYDGNGNQTKFMGQKVDGGTLRWISWTAEYDGNGNQTRETRYNKDGVVDWEESWTAEYDGNGNRTKYMRYNSDGSVRGWYEYKYAPIGVAIPEGESFAAYEGYSFYRDEDGNVTCYDSAGAKVINEFKCDGTYTYFFQADGTAMKDRLSYHPDGEHVIYFDRDGHEVFSDFANVKKSIADDPVDDFCFFDVYGYLYVDVVTYDKTGTVLYYANPYGVMERGKWFRFSDTVMYPGEHGLQPWEGAAGGYGYANADGTLMTNQWTYDWEGRSCYMQGNGVALYE